MVIDSISIQIDRPECGCVEIPEYATAQISARIYSDAYQRSHISKNGRGPPGAMGTLAIDLELWGRIRLFVSNLRS